MSRRTVDLLIDDLTQEPIPDGEGETIAFAFRGNTFEIDLSTKNAEAFERAMAPYIAAGRPVDRDAKVRAVMEELKYARGRARVRVWANANNIEIAARGRIPDDVIQAYANRTI